MKPLEEIGICTATLLPEPMSADGASFATVANAAATAGFRRISVWPSHFEQSDGAPNRALLTETGIGIEVIEAPMRWTQGPSRELAAHAEEVLALATSVGASNVATATLRRSMDSLPDAINGFAALCDAARERGVQVSLEFLPWTGVPDLATAWQIVRSVDRDNAGIVLDTWHWVRQPGGPDLELLATIPGHAIHVVQVSDVAAIAGNDLMTEAMTGRLVPGDGTVDFVALFAALATINAQPFIALEVFSSELLGRGPIEMATMLRERAQSTLAVAPPA